MCVRWEKSTGEQQSDAPTLRQELISTTEDATSDPGASPFETLIERVVGFMETYTGKSYG